MVLSAAVAAKNPINKDCEKMYGYKFAKNFDPSSDPDPCFLQQNDPTLQKNRIRILPVYTDPKL